MNIPGIYKIQSIVKQERFYIGSSLNLEYRWKCHLIELKNNHHHSKKLQRHFNKYGESDLIFIVVEPCFPQFLLQREQYYIDILKPFFNICLVAVSRLGTKDSPKRIEEKRILMIGNAYSIGNQNTKGKHWKVGKEGRNNMSKGKIGKHHSEQHKQNMRHPHRNPISEEKKKNMGRKKGCVPWNKGLKQNNVA
jgi:group I intron endonuclease